jgi:hypothetical protein
MKQAGKTIQIFLPDGNARGVKIAEITSRTVLSILVPRSELSNISKRDELNNVGVYLLFGQVDSKPLVYIGEAENCLNRLRQHNKSKDFWTHALVFVSKTQYFTKTHIKFLEWMCFDVANKVDRYILENSNIPTKPHISESVESDLFDNFNTIKILSSTLGFPIFDEIIKSKDNKMIYCKGKDAHAVGEYIEDGLVVFSKSKCNLIEPKSLGTSVSGMRSQLMEKGVLIKNGDILEFSSDYVFSSPSIAASVVLARNANGWIEWKFDSGKTLDEVIRK